MTTTLPTSVRDQAVLEAARAHGVRSWEILSPSRLKQVAHARHDAMARLRAITDETGAPRYSLPTIGRAFNRDHTTVIHALRQAHAREAGR